MKNTEKILGFTKEVSKIALVVSHRVLLGWAGLYEICSANIIYLRNPPLQILLFLHTPRITMQPSIYSTQTDLPSIKHKYQVSIDRLQLRLDTARSNLDRRLVQQLNDELIYLQNQL